MSEQIHITVPWDPASTGPNQRLHWAARSKRNKAAESAAAYGYSRAGCPVLGVPVVVSLVFRRARHLDDDNALSGCKPLIDYLFNGRITPRDSPRWVHYGEITWQIGKQFKGREEVVFVVRASETTANAFSEPHHGAGGSTDTPGGPKTQPRARQGQKAAIREGQEAA